MTPRRFAYHDSKTLGERFEGLDPPIARIVTHPFEDFIGLCHLLYDTTCYDQRCLVRMVHPHQFTLNRQVVMSPAPAAAERNTRNVVVRVDEMTTESTSVAKRRVKRTLE